MRIHYGARAPPSPRMIRPDARNYRSRLRIRGVGLPPLGRRHPGQLLEGGVERGLGVEPDALGDREDREVLLLRVDQPALRVIDPVGVDEVVEALTDALVHELREVLR